jgi:hypothetical protein
MSTTTKKLMEGFDARISALECVSEGNRNFLILKRDIQARLDEMAQSFDQRLENTASLQNMVDSLHTRIAHIESEMPALVLQSDTRQKHSLTPFIESQPIDQQLIISRIDALETALKASDAANRALWKKLLYGTHRQT